MGCLPYFKFYPADWLSDRPVRQLSLEARGLYWDLLAEAWKEGGIPADESERRRLADWLGVKGRRYERLWAEVERFWVHGENGRLVNPRQEQEREEAERVYQQRVEAGRKGGRPESKRQSGRETVRKANG